MLRLALRGSLFCSCLGMAYGVTIMIDPGHGGEDLGAKVSYWIKGKRESRMKVVLEKDMTLSFAKLLYRELKQRGHQVYLSRTHDRTVTLQSRAEMVDKINADILISIHANSSQYQDSRGVETFYLDNHKDKAIKRVEQLENAAFISEDPIVQQIKRDLVISQTAPLSKRLATSIHSALEEKVIGKYHLRNRGIRPGLFYVLALSPTAGGALGSGLSFQPRRSADGIASPLSAGLYPRSGRWSGPLDR